MNETSFAHTLFGAGVSQKPSPVGEELHFPAVMEGYRRAGKFFGK